MPDPLLHNCKGIFDLILISVSRYRSVFQLSPSDRLLAALHEYLSLKELSRLAFAVRHFFYLPLGALHPPLFFLFFLPRFRGCKGRNLSRFSKIFVKIFFSSPLSCLFPPTGAAKVTNPPLSLQTFFKVFFPPQSRPFARNCLCTNLFPCTLSQKTTRIPSFAECKDTHLSHTSKLHGHLFF